MSTTAVTKSESIRNVLTTNPGLTPKEVVESLAKKGTPVTANLVYLVKSKMNGNGNGAHNGNGHAAKSITSGRVKKELEKMISSARVPTIKPAPFHDVKIINADNALFTIGKIKTLAQEVGGLGKLKELVLSLCD